MHASNELMISKKFIKNFYEKFIFTIGGFRYRHPFLEILFQFNPIMVSPLIINNLNCFQLVTFYLVSA